MKAPQFVHHIHAGPASRGFLFTFAKTITMPFTYNYPRPALTVDTVLLKKTGTDDFVLLIKRLHPPFEGCWAIPGGFVEMDELLLDAASRELFEETGLQGLELKQFHTFDAIDRDPRHRTISVVFTARMHHEQALKAGDDAAEAAWFPVNQLPDLAFDHADILKKVKDYNHQSL